MAYGSAPAWPTWNGHERTARTRAHGMINTKGCNYWARFVVEYGRKTWDDER